MAALSSNPFDSLVDSGTEGAGLRRSDYDITNTVRVSSVRDVLRAVERLLVSTWSDVNLETIERAFADFDTLSPGACRASPALTPSITIDSTRLT